MGTIALSVLLSFALVLSAQSVVGHEEKITEIVNSELGPAQASLEEASKESGVVISSDELKKIGSEIKEAFQNIGDAISTEALSPGQGEQFVQSFMEGVTAGMENEAGKETGEADKEKESSEEGEGGAPSSGEGEGGVDGPSSGEGAEGDADGPSSGDEREASSSPSGDRNAPSPGDGEKAASSPTK